MKLLRLPQQKALSLLKHKDTLSPAENPEGNISNASFQEQSLDINNQSAENFTAELKQFRR